MAADINFLTAIVWEELGLAQFLVAAAVFAILDTYVRLSTFVSSRSGNRISEDAVLLILSLSFSIVMVRLLSSPLPFHTTLVQYDNVNALKHAMHRAEILTQALAAAKLYATVIIGMQFLGGGVCLGLAIRKNRQILSWLVLSFLCNFGGIVWLISSKGKVVNPLGLK